MILLKGMWKRWKSIKIINLSFYDIAFIKNCGIIKPSKENIVNRKEEGE